jgi:hypothetical protein
MKKTQERKKIILPNFKAQGYNDQLYARKGSSGSSNKEKGDNTSPEPNLSEKTTQSSNFYNISPNKDFKKLPSKTYDSSTTIQTNTKCTNNNTLKFNSDDSIQENDFEDCGKISNERLVNGSYENDDVDEFSKKSSLQNDFYTNSICEASQSFIDIGQKLINNIPNTFVKQYDRVKDFNEYNSVNSLSSNQFEQMLKNSNESNCRKLLLLAQKGDKEYFLETLEM